MHSELKRILDYLKAKRGFDFSGYRPSMIERRISQRLSATGQRHMGAYLQHIQTHPEELDRLVDVLTINVSRFFRNALVFEYLADKILPLLIQAKIRSGDHTLRVWSAGCAFGEEAYSMAILIRELSYRENPHLSLNIFATDIDKGALSKARKALYTFESIKEVKYGLLKRYFIPVVNSANADQAQWPVTFSLIPAITDTVGFSHYDMLDKGTFAPPESVFGSFDLVMCRNLLIYFDIHHQDIIFNKLFRSLSPEGYLVLGEAEIPTSAYEPYFRKVDSCCHVYQRR